MQAQTGPPRAHEQIVPYTGDVARKPKTSKGPRPPQGARLLALRKAAALTQIELARAIGVPHANIAFWEWSDKPPRSDLLPTLAKALGVKIEELLINANAESPAIRPGPIGEVQRTFEQVRKLPRKQQRKVLETVRALVNEYNREAS
jgi:transcriptional regulator with XRE-family HTH domain